MAETLTKITLGQRLLASREKRRLSLRTLAEKAGLSASFLSQVERDETSPSIASLEKIAMALGMDMADLFSRTPSDPVVRAKQRARLESGWSNGSIEVLSRVHGRLRPRMVTLEAGGATGLLPVESGEVFMLVVKGKLLARLSDRTVELAEGDSLHALPEHGLIELKNGTPNKAVALMVSTA
ncbi:MAG: helix-turn-helix domain-containing protein [Trueperaceae bacterium]